jgi:hypothetical protein
MLDGIGVGGTETTTVEGTDVGTDQDGTITAVVDGILITGTLVGI